MALSWRWCVFVQPLWGSALRFPLSSQLLLPKGARANPSPGDFTLRCSIWVILCLWLTHFKIHPASLLLLGWPAVPAHPNLSATYSSETQTVELSPLWYIKEGTKELSAYKNWVLIGILKALVNLDSLIKCWLTLFSACEGWKHNMPDLTL